MRFFRNSQEPCRRRGRGAVLPSLRVAGLCVLAVFAGGCALGPSDRRCGVRSVYADPPGTVPRVFFFPEVSNFRDIGGWEGVDGRKVRQGLVFRSGCVNSRARWYRPDHRCDFLSEDSRSYIVETLGVRTEIDLRKPASCGTRGTSPLGPGVRYFNVSSKAYENMATEEGREAFRRVFEIFLDAGNYPVLFHCVGGNDRAGAVAFILNGLLGVSPGDLRRDWELSRVWNGKADFTYEQRLVRLVRVFDDYDGETLNERIEGYVRSLGFTRSDIDRFRAFMLETPAH